MWSVLHATEWWETSNTYYIIPNAWGLRNWVRQVYFAYFYFIFFTCIFVTPASCGWTKEHISVFNHINREIVADWTDSSGFKMSFSANVWNVLFEGVWSWAWGLILTVWLDMKKIAHTLFLHFPFNLPSGFLHKTAHWLKVPSLEFRPLIDSNSFSTQIALI